MWVQSLGQEDPLEEGMATLSCILGWRIHGQRSLAGYRESDRSVAIEQTLSDCLTASSEQTCWVMCHESLLIVVENESYTG